MTDDGFHGFHLTALDARRFDFGNALRGYDRVRVDQFREQVAAELERMSRAHQELEQQARHTQEQLQSFRERDKAINEALVSAQQLRGEIKEQAEREAQLIVREAQAEADRLLASVRDELRRAEEEVQTLWRTRRSYLAQLRHHLERQLTELNAAESAPVPDFTTPRTAPAVRPETSTASARGEGTPRAPISTPSWLDTVEEGV